MFTGDNLAWLFLGGLGLILGWILFRRHFTPDARERRRRARSHGPVVSRKQGVSVRLAVKTDKARRKRRR
jgi:hypothetical protein